MFAFGAGQTGQLLSPAFRSLLDFISISGGYGRAMGCAMTTVFRNEARDFRIWTRLRDVTWCTNFVTYYDVITIARPNLELLSHIAKFALLTQGRALGETCAIFWVLLLVTLTRPRPALQDFTYFFFTIFD